MKRVIEESTLIEIYREVSRNIELNFGLTAALTSRHAPPDLTQTYAKMDLYLRDHEPNIYKAGRTTAQPPVDIIDKGIADIEAKTSAILEDDTDLSNVDTTAEDLIYSN